MKKAQASSSQQAPESSLEDLTDPALEEIYSYSDFESKYQG